MAKSQVNMQMRRKAPAKSDLWARPKYVVLQFAALKFKHRWLWKTEHFRYDAERVIGVTILFSPCVVKIYLAVKASYQTPWGNMQTEHRREGDDGAPSMDEAVKIE